MLPSSPSLVVPGWVSPGRGWPWGRQWGQVRFPVPTCWARAEPPPPGSCSAFSSAQKQPLCFL